MKCSECGSGLIDDEICVVCGNNIEVYEEVPSIDAKTAKVLAENNIDIANSWDGEIPF